MQNGGLLLSSTSQFMQTILHKFHYCLLKNMEVYLKLWPNFNQISHGLWNIVICRELFLRPVRFVSKPSTVINNLQVFCSQYHSSSNMARPGDGFYHQSSFIWGEYDQIFVVVDRFPELLTWNPTLEFALCCCRILFNHGMYYMVFLAILLDQNPTSQVICATQRLMAKQVLRCIQLYLLCYVHECPTKLGIYLHLAEWLL